MTVSTEKSPVGIPSLGYEQMSSLWPLIHDLLGGTDAMRAASQLWLPMESKESSTNYNSRLNPSFIVTVLR